MLEGEEKADLSNIQPLKSWFLRITLYVYTVMPRGPSLPRGGCMDDLPFHTPKSGNFSWHMVENDGGVIDHDLETGVNEWASVQWHISAGNVRIREDLVVEEPPDVFLELGHLNVCAELVKGMRVLGYTHRLEG